MAVTAVTPVKTFTLTRHESFKKVIKFKPGGLPLDLTGSTVKMYVAPQGGSLNEVEPSTTLLAGVNATATVLDLVDGSEFADAGLVTIDDEIIRYTSRTDTQLLGLTRGAEGTTAASHLAIAAVVTMSTEFQITASGPADQKLFVQPASTLSADINSSVTSLTVADANNFGAKGFVKIDSEIIEYTSRTATQLLGLVRGSASTTTASHTTSAVVKTLGQVRVYINDETIDTYTWRKAKGRFEIEDSLGDKNQKFYYTLLFEKSYA